MMKPTRLFLIIGILFGVGLAVFAPFGTGFDEDKHLARVFDISGLHMLPNRSIYDKTVYFSEFHTLSYRRFFYRDQGAELFTPAYFSVKGNYGSMAVETTMSTYPPLMFFPQAGVAGIAWRVKDLPIIPVVIVIRLVTLAVYLLGCYLAIRTTPVAKWLFLVAALLPTPLYQASTVNGDGYTHAVSLLFIAVVLSVVFQTEATISRGRFLSLCAAVFFSGDGQTREHLIAALAAAHSRARFHHALPAAWVDFADRGDERLSPGVDLLQLHEHQLGSGIDENGCFKRVITIMGLSERVLAVAAFPLAHVVWLDDRRVGLLGNLCIPAGLRACGRGSACCHPFYRT